MRRHLLALALLLAGCAGGADLRAPSTAAEWQQFNALSVDVTRVVQPLQAKNVDLCSTSEARCSLTTNINFSSEIGAFSDRTTIYLTDDLLRFMQNDDERAVVIGHEWGHVLLQHQALVGRVSRRELERQADCVGAILAVRAGFDAVRGAEALRRMSYTTQGIQHSASASREYPTWGERFQSTLSAAQQATAAHQRGDPLPPPEIQRICGVSP